MFTKNYILLTIDVEDWFQVENFKPWIPFATWDQRELRVEKNVHRLLDLFDSCEVAGKPGSLEVSDPQSTIANRQLTKSNILAVKPRATFFILGWLADRLPNLIREIKSRGHEIASHGCNHELPELLSVDKLKQDLTGSKKLLEDITGAEVAGYRAPSFAINDNILKIIEDASYLYDSSYNSFSLHGRYGKISLNGFGKKGIGHKLSDNFYELPVSNLMINRWVLPLGGGGYFRLAPYQLFRHGVKAILKKDEAYIFYMHPWEIDPEQPKVNQADFNSKIRHYTNLSKTQARLRRLIESFDHCHYITCSHYLKL